VPCVPCKTDAAPRRCGRADFAFSLGADLCADLCARPAFSNPVRGARAVPRAAHSTAGELTERLARVPADGVVHRERRERVRPAGQHAQQPAQARGRPRQGARGATAAPAYRLSAWGPSAPAKNAPPAHAPPAQGAQLTTEQVLKWQHLSLKDAAKACCMGTTQVRRASRLRARHASSDDPTTALTLATRAVQAAVPRAGHRPLAAPQAGQPGGSGAQPGGAPRAAARRYRRRARRAD